MNQDSDGSTYATAAKYQTSQKQEAGDSKRENEDDLRPTLIGARPVASGGFSTSSVSEEFFKELKNIEKSFVQSGGQKNMLEDDAKDIGGDKAAEAPRSAPQAATITRLRAQTRTVTKEKTEPNKPAAKVAGGATLSAIAALRSEATRQSAVTSSAGTAPITARRRRAAPRRRRLLWRTTAANRSPSRAASTRVTAPGRSTSRRRGGHPLLRATDKKSHSSRTRSRSNSQRRCIDGPVESTVEKHVLELNFPASPLMRSISNLLKLHCPCEDNVEDKEVEDDNEDDDDEEKNDANAERFVHRMRLGQTCELQGDSQVVLVSLPEPHKLTVEHVIRSSSCLVQEERCKSRHLDDSKQVCAERDREKRPIDKKGARCEGTTPDVPRIRRKHSYVRHTRRLKVPHVRQDILAPSKSLHPCSSSSSDSSEDDDANDVTYSKEKGAEEVVVRPAITKSSWRSRAAGREEIAGGGSSRQRELRLTIPKVKSSDYASDTGQKRSSARRKTKRSSKARRH
ncbi:hypothetical protein HPB51_003157 [Rhipicephalus microplus]|uniref:Uncharacterized protein n=1 Tax=Rhipicephalus microplus TaxID=6941 RepID=A0A9J6EKK4_RHIMP|nr:hypothetical protein HPB51_003157 [Rhipicephalus microplus]